jgi:hypothetical protein
LPLTVNAISLGVESQATSFSGRDSLGLDATLAIPLSPALSLTGDLQRQRERVQFQSLGSIQCTDGVLRPHSYTAMGCRFIDESLSGVNQTALRLGARFETDSTSTSVSWFTRNSELTENGASRFSPGPAGSLGTDLLTPVMANPLLPALPVRQALSYFDGQASGVDLNFQLGMATNDHGDLRFGLALSQVLDAQFGGIYSSMTPLGWTIADSFNTARLNFEWDYGAVSSGVQGFYRDQVDFLNGGSLDSVTTFDVHFTWRTPWNADLSVGASNILNSGIDENVSVDSQATDPF